MIMNVKHYLRIILITIFLINCNFYKEEMKGKGDEDICRFLYLTYINMTLNDPYITLDEKNNKILIMTLQASYNCSGKRED